MPPSISIIVPVYKAEPYLHRCVDSLLAQTFTDFEVLLIDDGSPDRSGEICDDYARKDARVRVFHQENGGVSVARQRGLDEALGEYTIHADPDDWVEPDMLEALYRKAKEDDADMVICDFVNEYKTGGVICKQDPSVCTAEVVQKQLLFQQLHGSCCNKLVRRVCYSKYGVSFPKDIIRWEDLYVMCALLSNPIKVSYLPKAFYHYDLMSNANSIVRKPTMQGLKSQIFFIEHFSKVGIPAKELCPSMMATLELAYASALIPIRKISALFPDVNEAYICSDRNGIIAKGVKAALRGNVIKAYLCRRLLQLYLKLKHG